MSLFWNALSIPSMAGTTVGASSCCARSESCKEPAKRSDRTASILRQETYILVTLSSFAPYDTFAPAYFTIQCFRGAHSLQKKWSHATSETLARQVLTHPDKTCSSGAVSAFADLN